MRRQLRHVPGEASPGRHHVAQREAEQHQSHSEKEGPPVPPVAHPVLAQMLARPVHVGGQRLNSHRQSAHQQRTERFQPRNQRVGRQTIHRSVAQRLHVVHEQHGDDRKHVPEYRNSGEEKLPHRLNMQFQGAE